MSRFAVLGVTILDYARMFVRETNLEQRALRRHNRVGETAGGPTGRHSNDEFGSVGKLPVQHHECLRIFGRSDELGWQSCGSSDS